MTTTIQQLAEWGYHLVPFRKRSSLSDPAKPAITDYYAKESQAKLPGLMRMSLDWAVVPTFACVLDLEMKNGLDGISDLRAICAKHGTTYEEIATGPQTRTKSGGVHLWYRQPDSRKLVGGLHIAPGVECKATNGTVHVPPSVGYVAIRDLCCADDLPAVPDFISEIWEHHARPRNEPRDYGITTIPNGERRGFALSVAGKLRNDFGMSEAEIYGCLCVIRDNRFDDPGTFTDSEVSQIAKDIGRKSISNMDGLALAGDPLAMSIARLCGKRK